MNDKTPAQVDPLLAASQHGFSSDALLEALHSSSSTLEGIARQLSTMSAPIVGPVVPSWAESQCCTSSLEVDVDTHLHQLRLRVAASREKLESQSEGALPKMLRQRKSTSGSIMKILSVESPQKKAVNSSNQTPEHQDLLADWKPPALNVSFPVEGVAKEVQAAQRSAAPEPLQGSSDSAAKVRSTMHRNHRYDLLRSDDGAGRVQAQPRPAVVQGNGASTGRLQEPVQQTRKRLEQPPQQHAPPADQSTKRPLAAFDKKEYVTQILSRKNGNQDADGPLLKSPRRRLSPQPIKKPHDQKRVLLSPDVRHEAHHRQPQTLMSPPPEGREIGQRNFHTSNDDDNDDVWFDRDVQGTQDYAVLRELRMEPIEHVSRVLHQSIDESEIAETVASQHTRTKSIEVVRAVAPTTKSNEASVASLIQPDVTAKRSVSQTVLSSNTPHSNATLFPVMAANDLMTRALCAANFFGTSFALPASNGDQQQTIRSLSVDELLSQYA